MKKDAPSHEEPLPATLGFVFALGIFIAVVWVSMFFLLSSRW
jgi:hypothetical protein